MNINRDYIFNLRDSNILIPKLKPSSSQKESSYWTLLQRRTLLQVSKSALAKTQTGNQEKVYKDWLSGKSCRRTSAEFHLDSTLSLEVFFRLLL